MAGSYALAEAHRQLTKCPPSVSRSPSPRSCCTSATNVYSPPSPVLSSQLFKTVRLARTEDSLFTCLAATEHNFCVRANSHLSRCVVRRTRAPQIGNCALKLFFQSFSSLSSSSPRREPLRVGRLVRFEKLIVSVSSPVCSCTSDGRGALSPCVLSYFPSEFRLEFSALALPEQSGTPPLTLPPGDRCIVCGRPTLHHRRGRAALASRPAGSRVTLASMSRRTHISCVIFSKLICVEPFRL